LFSSSHSQPLLGFKSEQERDEHLRSMLVSEAEKAKAQQAADKAKLDLRERDASFVSETYAECYPEYVWFGTPNLRQQQQQQQQQCSTNRCHAHTTTTSFGLFFCAHHRTYSGSALSSYAYDSDEEDLSKMDPGTSKKKQVCCHHVNARKQWECTARHF
jgi:hypothetical protein